MIEKLFTCSCRWGSLTNCFGRWRKWQICCLLFIDIVHHWDWLSFCLRGVRAEFGVFWWFGCQFGGRGGQLIWAFFFCWLLLTLGEPFFQQFEAPFDSIVDHFLWAVVVLVSFLHSLIFTVSWRSALNLGRMPTSSSKKTWNFFILFLLRSTILSLLSFPRDGNCFLDLVLRRVSLMLELRMESRRSME